ncbi:hypothetical protein [Massilia yuzhufengensis]|uniref:Uncharacterized protein n=1 Tax=Massilia yuzhufengensis TaxID=1164594 RepID=A0A1I1MJU4_9BURK|nr:hypothetical protein [Massilia yuzhufengensis]SFC85651.1 hypothetical protein SAMN05216204_11159 [Massilia yuzhufengensis]
MTTAAIEYRQAAPLFPRLSAGLRAKLRRAVEMFAQPYVIQGYQYD